MLRITLLILLGVASSSCLSTYRLSRQQLQDRVDARFPITKRAMVVALTLEHPRVVFPGDDGQLGLVVQVKVDASVASVQVEAQAEGQVTYEPEQGAFFLKAPRRITLRNLHAGTAESPQLRVDATLENLISTLLPQLMAEVLDVVPVYVLDPSKDEELKVKNQLKRVRVRDEALIIELR